LAALVSLLRLKVKIGVAMLVSACLAGLLLRVWPADAGERRVTFSFRLPLCCCW